MLKRLANKLVMYHTVQSHLNLNNSIWTSVPAMGIIVSDFELLLTRIESYRQLIQENKKGITQQKAAQQALVISHTYELLSVLYAMATKKSNATLAAKVNYTETELLKKRDDQLVSICLSIVEIATEQLTELTAYQVSGDELIALKEEIEQFDAILPTGRVSVVERKAANEKLKDLFLEADALLKNQLDRIMVRYRKSNTEFYTIYRNTRHIVNYGIRHEKAKEPEKEA